MGERTERHRVFVGLGNPGTKYEMTRHNMGAIIVEGFAGIHGMVLKKDSRFHAKIAKKSLLGSTVHVVFPTTYMNESGSAIRKYIDYYKLSPLDIVVVSDDADLPFGELRLRGQGSSGGHNGLKSVERSLGTSKYVRLRVGIGRERDFVKELSDFVLDKFTKEEEELLYRTVKEGAAVLGKLVNEPLESVMNVVNLTAKEDKKKVQEKNPKNTIEGDKQEEKL